MKRIAVITYHAAHNFGSVLQAYALQTYIERLLNDTGGNYTYTILNYRTELQKSMYSVLPKLDSAKNVVKFIMRLPYYYKYKKKCAAFEEFIHNELHTGREINNSDEMATDALGYNYFISGGDQIWNVRSCDFDDVNYLSFVKRGKRISYSASFGPLSIDWDRYDRYKYCTLLKKYNEISVRETASHENVRLLSGIDSQIHIDPTMLLDANKWREIGSDKNYNDGKYILFYCLEPVKAQIDTAYKISKITGFPIISTKYNNKSDYFNRFIKLYETGPKDFISLVNHAAFVITSSFHGTIFSIIFKKPFYVFDGIQDNRISTLLEYTGMQKRSIENSEESFDVQSMFNIDYKIAEIFLENERIRSMDYLKNALEL